MRSEVCETRVCSETRGSREGDCDGVGVLGREDADAVADDDDEVWEAC